MSCVVKFTIGDLNYSLNNVELDTQQEILPQIAKLFSINFTGVSSIREALKKNFDSDKLVDIKLYKSGNSNLVPNYSGQELRTLFPEYKWGEYVPDVLLVDNLLWTTSSFSNLFTYVRTIGDDNQEHISFIVPRRFIGQFSKISQMLTYQKQLKDFKLKSQEEYEALKKKSEESIEDNTELMRYDNLLNLYNQLNKLSTQINQYYTTGNYETDNSVFKLIKAGTVIQNSDAVINRYSRHYKQLLGRIQKIKELTSELSKLDESSEDEKIKKKIKELNDNIFKYDKLIRSDLQGIRSALQNLSTKRNIIQKLLNEKDLINSADPRKNYKSLNGYLTEDKLTELLTNTEKTFQEYLDQMKEIFDKNSDVEVVKDNNFNYQTIDEISQFDSNELSLFNESFQQEKLDGETTPDVLLEDIIHDRKRVNNLPSDLQSQVSKLRSQLMGRDKEINFSNQYMNAIAYQATAHNNTIHNSYIAKLIQEQFPDYFTPDEINTLYKVYDQQVKLSTKKDQETFKSAITKINTYINNEFNRKQNSFYLTKDTDNNHYVLKKKTDKLLSRDISYKEKAAIAFVNTDENSRVLYNELINIAPETDENDNIIRVNGYYIYKFKTADGEKYYALKDRVTAQTPAAITRGFNSIEEAKADAKQRFLSSKLSDGAILLRYKQVPYLLSMSQTGRFWKQGEIAESIDLTSIDEDFGTDYGLQPVGDLTVEEFYLWIDSKYYSEYAKQIKNNLTTLEQIAAFKTLIKNNDIDSYKAIQLSEALAKAPINYFLVTENTSVYETKYGTERRYTKFRQIRNYDPDFKPEQKKQKTFEQIKIDSVVDWFAMKNFFAQHRIHMELRNGQQLKEQIGTNQIDGFTQNGIIYINTDVATESKAFHELTHILLGLVKTYSGTQKGYQELLLNYILASNNSDPAKVKLIQDNLSDISKITPDMFVEKFAQSFNQKLNDYKEIINKLNLSKEESFLYIIEEMLADDYGKYLDQNFTPIEDLFNQIDKLVQTLPLIKDEGIKTAIIGNNKFQFFNSLTNFRQVFEQTGFSIRPDKGISSSEIKTNEYDIREEHINKFISSLESTRSKLTDITEDEGIFKHCE